jgi:hypothetical protein
VNDAPVSVADSGTTNEDTALNINVLSNDSDIDTSSSLLTAVVCTPPTHGSVVVEANQTLTYTPAANYNGGDAFTYKAFDGLAYSACTSVTVTVTAGVVGVNCLVGRI